MQFGPNARAFEVIDGVCFKILTQPDLLNCDFSLFKDAQGYLIL